MVQKGSKQTFILLAIVFSIIGGGSYFASQKIMCLPGLTNKCLFVTSGDNIFNAKGTTIDLTTAQLIRVSSYVSFGLGGVFLLAGLLKN